MFTGIIEEAGSVLKQVAAIAIILGALGLAGCGTSTGPTVAPTATPGATATPTPTPAPQQVSFPFSRIESDVEVTVAQVRALGSGTLTEIGLRGIKAKDGYQFIGVRITFRNLRHERSTEYGVVGPLLALKTDRSNVYEGEGLPIFHLSDFGPQEVKQAWDYFEIRQDERAVELWEYEVIVPGGPISQQRVTHVWKLE